MINHYLLETETQILHPWETNGGIMKLLASTPTYPKQFIDFGFYFFGPDFGSPYGISRTVGANLYGIDFPKDAWDLGQDHTRAVIVGSNDTYDETMCDLLASILGDRFMSRLDIDMHEESIWHYPEGLVQLTKMYPLNAPKTHEMHRKIYQMQRPPFKFAFSLQLADLAPTAGNGVTQPYGIIQMSSAVVALHETIAKRVFEILERFGKEDESYASLFSELELALQENKIGIGSNRILATALFAAVQAGNYSHFRIGSPDLLRLYFNNIRLGNIAKITKTKSN